MPKTCDDCACFSVSSSICTRTGTYVNIKTPVCHMYEATLKILDHSVVVVCPRPEPGKEAPLPTYHELRAEIVKLSDRNRDLVARVEYLENELRKDNLVNKDNRATVEHIRILLGEIL